MQMVYAFNLSLVNISKNDLGYRHIQSKHHKPF